MDGLIAGVTFTLVAVLLLAAWRALDRRADERTWNALVKSAGPTQEVFDPSMLAGLPDAARRYFLFTIRTGAPLHRAVEIEMTGVLGLGNQDKPGYRAMSARQILAPPCGLVWKLQAGPISGSDAVTPEFSWTRFWLFGLIPVVRAGGDEDHHRSAFGRVVAEGAFWAPAALLPGAGVRWEAIDDSTARAVVTSGRFTQSVDLSVADDGQPTRVVIQRWSNANPDKQFRQQPFGGYLSAFSDFDGYRLPTRVEGGNHIGTDAYFPFYKTEVTAVGFPATISRTESAPTGLIPS